MMTTEFQKRQDAKPDQWTLAWWQERFQEVLQGYRGATHAINRSIAEFEGVHERIRELERQREADAARIGELQERVEKMAQWAATIQRGQAES